MTTATTLHATNSREILALLPVLMGYTVANSLVVAMFAENLHTGKQRSQSVMRMDLPGKSTGAAEAEACADAAVQATLALPGISAVFGVVFTDERCDDTGSAPHRAFAHTLDGALQRAGIGCIDICWVTPSGWGSYVEPIAGQPLALDTIDADPMRLEAMLHVDHRIADLADLASLPVIDPAVRARVSQAVAKRLAALPERFLIRECKSVLRLPARKLMRTLVEADPDRLPEPSVIMLGTLLQLPLLRELSLVRTAFPGQITELSYGLVIDYQLSIPVREWSGDDRGAYRITAPILDGGIAQPPDRGALTRAVSTLATVAGSLEPQLRAGPQCALAWTCWALGLNTPARKHLEEVRRIDPDHEMLSLFGEAVEDGIMPAWATLR